MMFVLDTNVLIYAVDDTSPYHAACRAFVERCRLQAGAWHLTWGIFYEYLRVATHPRICPRPLSAGEAWGFFEGMLRSPGLSMLAARERHAAVASEVLRETPGLSGNAMHDAETAILMREHGIKTIYTRDLGFHRFKFLDVVDPLTVEGRK
ncbi:MAG: TA system VapC family ribonuclease toxin [Rhodospirillaceae bacterium]|nr:TA system VapC family ribonuclease toxin [Rhodospirillaceae bacterium]